MKSTKPNQQENKKRNTSQTIGDMLSEELKKKLNSVAKDKFTSKNGVNEQTQSNTESKRII